MKSTIIFHTQPDGHFNALDAMEFKSLEVVELEPSGQGIPQGFRHFEAQATQGPVVLSVPEDKLVSFNSHTWFMNQNPLDFRSELSLKKSSMTSGSRNAEQKPLHLQALREVAHISTVWKETAKVQVDRRLTTHLEEITCDLGVEEVVVDRRTVDRVLAEGEEVKTQVLPDGTLVIPVIQERLVIQKVRVLCEEVVVKKHTGSVPFSSSVELRAMELDVTKTPLS